MQRWELAWLASRNNPRLFVTDVLAAEIEPWQGEALDAIARHDRVSIRAGHGVGKTTVLAWVTLWFMLTRKPFKIPITANSQDQLRDVVWPEIRKWHARLPTALRCEIDVAAERVSLASSPGCFAVARTASSDNPEALQGFHDDNLLFLIEEASGIADIVFQVAQGSLSTPGAKILMFANPTRISGFFYESHHKLRDRWHTMRVNSEDVPRARGHIEDIALQYGRDSNIYRVRVLGEFPTSEDDVVVPLHLCEAAVRRKVEPLERFRPVWGLDVARYGDDRTALAKRQGNAMLEPVKSWRNKSTMEVAGLVMAEYQDTKQVNPDQLPSEILVDVIGIGAGVVDRCRELGLPVRGVNVGESPAIRERYMRLRDDLWWRARDWLLAADAKLADDDALIAELTSPKYKLTSAGKVQVESKDDMKKRGLRSPDLADAFILTFAGGLDERDPREIDRYRPKRRPQGSWMAV